VQEVRVLLSIEAVRELVQGSELVIDDGELRIILSCNDEAVATFRTQVERALLHMLPVGETPH
jgi:acylphosphatase